MRMDWIGGLIAGVVIAFGSNQAEAAPSVSESKSNPASAKAPTPPSLRLRVEPHGSHHPWTLRISNTDRRPIEVMDDLSLLWLEVLPPGGGSTAICKLPAPLRSTSNSDSHAIELHPAEELLRNFDPRLYCFSATTPTPLVPGAKVTPHIGWPTRPSSKRAKEKANPSDDSHWFARRKALGSPSRQREAGLGTLSGEETLLGPACVNWLLKNTSVEPQADFSLAMVSGSDAPSPRAATATLSVRNQTKVPQTLFLRRESIEYRVSGPTGSVVCPAATVGPQPARESFATLRPGASKTFTTLLFEVCPHRVFAEAGLYQVTASLPLRTNSDSAAGSPVLLVLKAQNSVLVRTQRDAPTLPTEQLGRVLLKSHSNTSTGRPSRPTRRTGLSKGLKLPAFDTIE